MDSSLRGNDGLRVHSLSRRLSGHDFLSRHSGRSDGLPQLFFGAKAGSVIPIFAFAAAIRL